MLLMVKVPFFKYSYIYYAKNKHQIATKTDNFDNTVLLSLFLYIKENVTSLIVNRQTASLCFEGEVAMRRRITKTDITKWSSNLSVLTILVLMYQNVRNGRQCVTKSSAVIPHHLRIPCKFTYGLGHAFTLLNMGCHDMMCDCCL